MLLGDYLRLRPPGTFTEPLPRGDGHSVIVFPGFSSDFLTLPFRRWLGELGYEVAGWSAGFNLGPTPSAWRIAHAQLAAIAKQSERKVSLVGHSLGGVLARALANDHPQLVRRVITICSPFRLPAASPLAALYQAFSPWHIDPALLLPKLAEPPPAPTTAIYVPQDRIVCSLCCMDVPAEGRENVAIDGSHSTMLSHPETLRIIADRLPRP